MNSAYVRKWGKGQKVYINGPWGPTPGTITKVFRNKEIRYEVTTTGGQIVKRWQHELTERE